MPVYHQTVLIIATMMTYRKGALWRIDTPSGYISADGNAHYYIRDHQGNVRQVTDSDGNVEQDSHYYPYGMLMGESSDILATARAGRNPLTDNRNPYLYGGKEYLTTAGANLLDFTTRTYDPSTLLFHTPDPLRDKYLPVNSYLYCLGNPINLIDPTGLEPSKEEGARIADHVYDGKVKLIGGWEEEENSIFNITDKDTGLKSRLYSRKLDDGKKEYVIAFAGTQIGDLNDFINDALQVVGLSAQYQQALQLVKDNYHELTGKGKVTFVGHSLGGGISAACAYAVGGRAITYNPAGVSMLTRMPNTSAQIDAYVTITDPLYITQAASPFLPNADGIIHYQLPGRPTIFFGHQIKNFYEPNIVERLIDACNSFRQWISKCME